MALYAAADGKSVRTPRGSATPSLTAPLTGRPCVPMHRVTVRAGDPPPARGVHCPESALATAFVWVGHTGAGGQREGVQVVPTRPHDGQLATILLVVDRPGP